MSFNTIQNGLNNHTRFNYAGARRVIFVAADDIYQAQVLSGDTVDQLVLRGNRKFHLFDNLEAISYQETPTRSKNGTLYNVSLGFNSGVQTVEKNRLFDQLGDNDLVGIVQDRMNRWWCLGLDQPLKMTTTEQKIDDDSNSYAIKFTTQQCERSKVMSDRWVANINSLNFSAMIDGASGFGVPVTLLVQSPTSGVTAPGTQVAGNILNMVVSPPSGYVIQKTDGEIMMLPGRTVKLPLAAVNGQNHLVKDATGGAAQQPITVDGNGHAIDGRPLATIDTSYGALTVTFMDDQWLVKNFVN